MLRPGAPAPSSPCGVTLPQCMRLEGSHLLPEAPGGPTPAQTRSPLSNSVIQGLLSPFSVRGLQLPVISTALRDVSAFLSAWPEWGSALTGPPPGQAEDQCHLLGMGCRGYGAAGATRLSAKTTPPIPAPFLGALGSWARSLTFHVTLPSLGCDSCRLPCCTWE